MQQPGNQSFHRGNDRIIGGVCSGLAEGFHVEVLWVRLAFVGLAFINGAGVLLYIVLWILMGERTGSRTQGPTVFETMGNDVKRAWVDLRTQFAGVTPASSSTTSAPADAAPQAASPPVAVAAGPAPAVPPPPQTASSNPPFIFGAILIVIGVAFLAANTNLLDWSVIWPGILVALGIWLLIRNLEKRP